MLLDREQAGIEIVGVHVVPEYLIAQCEIGAFVNLSPHHRIVPEVLVWGEEAGALLARRDPALSVDTTRVDVAVERETTGGVDEGTGVPGEGEFGLSLDRQPLQLVDRLSKHVKRKLF